MSLYMDTSSLLKFHIEEMGSATVRGLMADAQMLTMSRVAYAEARAGLARAYRSDRLSAVAYRDALQTFEIQWADITVIELSDALVRLAGDLAERHGLRGFDAIHLASALAVQQHNGDSVSFSAWDDRLMQAAASEGLTPASRA